MQASHQVILPPLHLPSTSFSFVAWLSSVLGFVVVVLRATTHTTRKIVVVIVVVSCSKKLLAPALEWLLERRSKWRSWQCVVLNRRVGWARGCGHRRATARGFGGWFDHGEYGKKIANELCYLKSRINEGRCVSWKDGIWTTDLWLEGSALWRYICVCRPWFCTKAKPSHRRMASHE